MSIMNKAVMSKFPANFAISVITLICRNYSFHIVLIFIIIKNLFQFSVT